MNPGPFTLRELVWMADAKGRDEWSRTASLLALIANAHRDPKRARAFTPSDFNPFVETGQSTGKVRDLSILKDVFVREEDTTKGTKITK